MNNSTHTMLLLQTIDRIQGAYAPSTIRAYRSDFMEFIRYCQRVSKPSLPANPSALSGFITHLTSIRRSSAGIRRAVAGIGTIHRLNRLSDPSKDPEVLIEMRRMHRALGRASSQAYGINADLLTQMIEATGVGPIALRNRALLQIAYDTLCRRSELLSLRIEDIKSVSRQELVKFSILLRRSKTDQDGTGRWLHLSDRASQLLGEWLSVLDQNEGFIFQGVGRPERLGQPIGVTQVNRIYKRVAHSINLPQEIIEKISGHSFRVGAAQDLLCSGASLPVIMSKGRWSKTDTVMRYIEHVNYSN